MTDEGVRTDGLRLRDMRPQEHEQWLALTHRAYLAEQHASPTTVELVRRLREGHRRRVVVETSDRLVATFRSYAVPLPLPGGPGRCAPTDAISSVAVAATHRRRGLLRQLMTDDLHAARERGDTLAVLIAMEGGIYERYGFGAATRACRWTLDAREARFRTDPVREGRVHLDPCEAPDLVDVAPALHDRLAARSPGAMPREPLWWRSALGLEAEDDAERRRLRPAVLARDDSGAVVGALTYRAVESWEGRRTTARAEVAELLADGPAATTALWRHLAEVDLVTSVTASYRSPFEALPELLLDPRAATQSEHEDFAWVRVLDVPAALTARRYALPGAVTVEVVDALGLAGGRWRLDVGEDGTATAEPTSAEPDVVLPVEVLGATVLGQVPLAGHAAAGRVDERTPGAARRLGALLWDPSTAVLGRTWF
ncbi:GNAT family N-acetyltransferase [Pseudokineococcus sp. 1T1Z-3]|uniref:GNAT family N-acetyltransferase n=1 Tax=Pseudokineococcus sp. 1T1Z-3 TaxID=3132745 RepID=UPI0030A8C7E3